MWLVHIDSISFSVCLDKMGGMLIIELFVRKNNFRGCISKADLENFILEFLPIWNLWDLHINKSMTMLEILLQSVRGSNIIVWVHFPFWMRASGVRLYWVLLLISHSYFQVWETTVVDRLDWQREIRNGGTLSTQNQRWSSENEFWTD